MILWKKPLRTHVYASPPPEVPGLTESVLHLFPGVPQDFEAVRVFEAVK